MLQVLQTLPFLLPGIKVVGLEYSMREAEPSHCLSCGKHELVLYIRVSEYGFGQNTETFVSLLPVSGDGASK